MNNPFNPVPTTSPDMAQGNNPYDIEPTDRDTTGNSTGGLNTVPGDGSNSSSGSTGSSGKTKWANDPKADYSSWNGDTYGYLMYMSNTYGGAWTDRFMNWVENEGSADKAREWTANREDTQYQRLVEDLKAAGINPYILLQSNATPVSSSSSGSSYSGSYSSNEELKKEQNSLKWIQLITSIISTVIMVAAFA